MVDNISYIDQVGDFYISDDIIDQIEENNDYLYFQNIICIVNCDNLKSLKNIPSSCRHIVLKSLSKLESLKYLPKQIDNYLYIGNCEHLHHELWRICYINFMTNHLRKIHIVSKSIRHTDLENLVMKYINTGPRGALRLQNELIDLGYAGEEVIS